MHRFRAVIAGPGREFTNNYTRMDSYIESELSQRPIYFLGRACIQTYDSNGTHASRHMQLRSAVLMGKKHLGKGTRTGRSCLFVCNCFILAIQSERKGENGKKEWQET